MQFSDRRSELYLGRYVREDGKTPTDEPFLYATRDLTTHAVCVGMTGSGKTGLGIILIEEAALDGIPALVIDPKGDMTNLLLSFPSLRPDDFRPWVSPERAQTREVPLDEHASEVARSWRKGLAEWGIDETRIARLKQNARFALYTPGSDAGRPVSIVQSLQARPLDWDREAEVLRERISSIVSAILALVDIDSDPVIGREHSLLSTIVEQSWRADQDMDLAKLITQVHKPPFERLGVLPLEVSYPEKERLSLTLALNGLLASPRFASWLEGDPLRIDALLRAPDDRPQVSIFYLAHLSDAERSFFITLLLEQVRSWLRAQEGTSHLRALLYVDELYGLMPPHPASPPTKAPLLALLKQARSQGMGLVLSTQNPVDLDYKGLSNAGTWFIGKLQTANDRQRVLEGLSGASLEAGIAVDKRSLDEMIARLDSRIFLVNAAHTDAPRLFKTRHTMSYLRGPLTRSQIRRLSDQERQPVVAQRPRVATIGPVAPSKPPPADPWEEFGSSPPVLPSGVDQYFLPAQLSLEWAIRNAESQGQQIIYQDKQLVYHPALLARAAVRIDNNTRKVHERIAVSRVYPVPDNESFIDWREDPIVEGVDELDSRAAQGARFALLPAVLGDGRRLKRMLKDFSDHIYRETAITLSYHPVLKLTSRVDESESQFKRRCYRAVEEKSDAEIGKLGKRYQSKIDRLRARIRREQREQEQDEVEYDARKREELLSAGESVLNILSRRRSSRVFSTASRKRRLTQQAKADVEESVEAIQDLEEQFEDLLDDLEREQAEIQDRWSEAVDQLETVQVRPRRADVSVEAWGVAWLPYWHILFEEQGSMRRPSLAAFEPSTPS